MRRRGRERGKGVFRSGCGNGDNERTSHITFSSAFPTGEVAMTPDAGRGRSWTSVLAAAAAAAADAAAAAHAELEETLGRTLHILPARSSNTYQTLVID